LVRIDGRCRRAKHPAELTRLADDSPINPGRIPSS